MGWCFMTSDWRPIEIAPKDKRILLFCDRIIPCIATGHWYSDERKIDDAVAYRTNGWLIDGMDHPCNMAPFIPTHWMPLPKPPQ